MSFSVVMIGAGNVAVNMAHALASEGFQIRQVYSRTELSASFLAGTLGASFTIQPASIVQDADIYIIALRDDAIAGFLDSAPLNDRLLVHCSGSLPLSILEPHTSRRGVIYPLQTLSKERIIDFRNVPLCIEASDSNTETIINEMACTLSSKVMMVNSDRRRALHVAAVFACNFVNHCYALASRLLKDNDMDFSVLHPLIMETCQKAVQLPPELVQTGPAVRNDATTMEVHLKMLEKYPVFKSLYENLSHSISIFPPK